MISTIAMNRSGGEARMPSRRPATLSVYLLHEASASAAAVVSLPVSPPAVNGAVATPSTTCSLHGASKGAVVAVPEAIPGIVILNRHGEHSIPRRVRSAYFGTGSYAGGYRIARPGPPYAAMRLSSNDGRVPVEVSGIVDGYVSTRACRHAVKSMRSIPGIAPHLPPTPLKPRTPSTPIPYVKEVAIRVPLAALTTLHHALQTGFSDVTDGEPWKEALTNEVPLPLHDAAAASTATPTPKTKAATALLLIPSGFLNSHARRRLQQVRAHVEEACAAEYGSATYTSLAREDEYSNSNSVDGEHESDSVSHYDLVHHMASAADAEVTTATDEQEVHDESSSVRERLWEALHDSDNPSVGTFGSLLSSSTAQDDEPVLLTGEIPMTTEAAHPLTTVAPPTTAATGGSRARSYTLPTPRGRCNLSVGGSVSGSGGDTRGLSLRATEPADEVATLEITSVCQARLSDRRNARPSAGKCCVCIKGQGSANRSSSVSGIPDYLLS